MLRSYERNNPKLVWENKEGAHEPDTRIPGWSIRIFLGPRCRLQKKNVYETSEPMSPILFFLNSHVEHGYFWQFWVPCISYRLWFEWVAISHISQTPRIPDQLTSSFNQDRLHYVAVTKRLQIPVAKQVPISHSHYIKSQDIYGKRWSFALYFLHLGPWLRKGPCPSAIINDFHFHQHHCLYL